LKNSLASPTDNPATCRLHLSELHKKWVVNAGGKIEGAVKYLLHNIAKGDEDGLCEISPLISYAGEGLEEFCKDKVIKLPYHLEAKK
jgi:UDP-N-acetylglucosamine/UDP-N-acetylgalactosamine diphosphorylase